MLNMDGIGTLNKRVVILDYVDQEDECGLISQRKEVKYTVWAKVEPMRSREYLEQDKVKDKEVYRITIRYRPWVTADMLIQFKNEVYEIISLSNPYEGNVKLELLCVKRKAGVENGNDDLGAIPEADEPVDS